MWTNNFRTKELQIVSALGSDTWFNLCSFVFKMNREVLYMLLQCVQFI